MFYTYETYQGIYLVDIIYSIVEIFFKEFIDEYII